MKKVTVRSIATLIATASICLGVFTSFPAGTSPVMFSMQNFLVITSSCLLGSINGAGATGIFLMLGFLGIPVFSGFSSGIQYIQGINGGFLIGYFIVSIAAGLIMGSPVKAERHVKGRLYIKTALTSLFSYLIIYVPAILWFMKVQRESGTNYSFTESFNLVCAPFIALDIAKAALTVLICVPLRPVLSDILYDPE